MGSGSQPSEPLPPPTRGRLLASRRAARLPGGLANTSLQLTVSGTHIGVTLALVVWATRGRPRLQGILALLFLVTIVVLVGPAPSVIRASLMSSLAVWATMRRRPFQSLALLSAVVLGVLLVSPWLSRSLGFALSSAATAGIVLFARPLTTWLTDKLPREGRTRKLLAPAMAAVAVALTAQAATLFILPFANPWLPTWGVVANLAVAPIVPLLTLLSVGVAATCWWAPPLAAVLVKLAAPLANWVAGVALWASDLPFARLPWPEGTRGAVLLAALLVLAIVGARCIHSVVRGRDRPLGVPNRLPGLVNYVAGVSVSDAGGEVAVVD